MAKSAGIGGGFGGNERTEAPRSQEDSTVCSQEETPWWFRWLKLRDRRDVDEGRGCDRERSEAG